MNLWFYTDLDRKLVIARRDGIALLVGDELPHEQAQAQPARINRLQRDKRKDHPGRPSLNIRKVLRSFPE